MGFKGSLDSINLADIFQNLSMNQQTGTLRIWDGERTKSIYFQRGEVRYLARGRAEQGAREGRKTILLGEMLIGRAVASHEDVQRALAAQQGTGRLLGEIIVEQGICSAEDVGDLVRFQIEEEIYDLFSWERAEFEFTEGPPPEGLFDPEQQATELAIDTSRLIMEAARRIDEWERIRQVIPSMDEVYVATTSPELLPEGTSQIAGRILTFLDATRSLEAVVEDSYFSRFEVASHLVVMLDSDQARAATVEELSAGAGLCAQQGRPDRAAAVMEKALAQGHDSPELRQRLAEACVAAGENSKAAIHLNVLGDAMRAASDPEGAAAAYERITEILPGGPAAHEKLARLKAEQGEVDQALKHYTNLVQALMEAGRLDDAAARCREGLRVDQENTDLRNALAKVLLSSGGKDAAIEEFERLAEVFARTGQARPASEVFRRILQIDPRNRHAKRRLTQIVSGTGVKALESHALRNVLIAVVLALLALGGYLVIHEMTVLTKFEEAEKESRELEAEERFDEARAVWREIAGGWSVSVDLEARAGEHIQSIDAAEEFLRKRREDERHKLAEAAKQLYDRALAREKAYELDGFRAVIRELLAFEGAPEDLKAEAREYMKDVDTREQEVADYLRVRAKTGSRTDIASLEEERHRSRAIHLKYPDHPRLHDLKLPLLIESDPPGASVFVDDAPCGTSPLVHRYAVGATPAVRVELPGYMTEDELDVRDRIRVKLTLRRAVAWRYDAGSAVLSLSGGPRGTVLVASSRGVLTALDPAHAGPGSESQGVVWRFTTGEELVGIHSGTTVVGETVYFGTDRLYAIEYGSERPTWVAEFDDRGKGRIPGPPVIGAVQMRNDQEFVFATYDDPSLGGAVWAISARDGSSPWKVWPSQTRAGARCGPMFVGRDRRPEREERLYVPFKDGRVYELEAVQGETRQKLLAGSPSNFVGSMVSAAGSVWLVSGDGHLYGLDLDSPGRRPRTFAAGQAAITTDLTVAEGVGYFGDEKGRLHAVELRTLDRAWVPFAGEGRARTRPAAGGIGEGRGRVYFGTSAGWVYAVGREDGRLVWKYPVGDEVLCVYFTGRFLLAGARDGVVYAFDEEALK